MATASGLSDYDYQNLSNLTLGLKDLHQIETVTKVPIPIEIMEHFKSNWNQLMTPLRVQVPDTQSTFVFAISDIKCHCMMGLFPEIGRAWLTIDSDIYVSCRRQWIGPINSNFFLFVLLRLDLDIRTCTRCRLLRWTDRSHCQRWLGETKGRRVRCRCQVFTDSDHARRNCHFGRHIRWPNGVTGLV